MLHSPFASFHIHSLIYTVYDLSWFGDIFFHFSMWEISMVFQFHAILNKGAEKVQGCALAESGGPYWLTFTFGNHEILVFASNFYPGNHGSQGFKGYGLPTSFPRAQFSFFGFFCLFFNNIIHSIYNFTGTGQALQYSSLWFTKHWEVFFNQCIKEEIHEERWRTLLVLFLEACLCDVFVNICSLSAFQVRL